MEESAEDDWSCSICLKLVLDPIVSACGHDFCRECLLRWAEQHAPSLPVACPLCRAPIANNYQDVTRLGVCVRLRQAVEALFPAQLKRRREQQHHQQLAKREDGVHEGTAQRQAQAFQQARRGRARYLRVRRSRAPLLGGLQHVNPPSQDQSQQYSQHTQQQQHAPQQAPDALFWGGSSPSPPSPFLAHPPLVSPNLASGQGASGGGGSSSWSAQLVPHFCIGWCEPVELRRGRRGRKAKSTRLR